MQENTKDLLEKYKILIEEALEELKTPGKRHRQIPNILTSLRLLAPLFIIPAAIVGNAPLVLGLGTIFGLTDLVDGFIARKWKLTSELGADLDAITDKVFVGTLLLSGALSNPALFINIVAETAIALINVNQKKKGLSPSSTQIGKIKTWFLFSLAISSVVMKDIGIENIVKVLSLTTGIFQGFTIGAYINKYSNCNKTDISQDENKTIYPTSSKEETIKEYEKSKDYSYSPTTQEEINKSSISEKENFLNELKEMSEFLHLEQENTKEKNQVNDIIQKTKK